jgi:hypothetical protein
LCGFVERVASEMIEEAKRRSGAQGLEVPFIK